MTGVANVPLTYLDQVQRGIDFIEAHLTDDLDLGEVARRAGMSRWHFQRVFKALTQETVKTYIRSRRLAGALDALLGTDRAISEIAKDSGYGTQESFTRAFKAAFRLPPGEYRQIGTRHRFVRKVQLDEAYLRHIHAAPLEPVVYRQPVLRLVGVRTLFYGTDSERNNIGDKLPSLWQEFSSRLEEIAGRVPGVCYGVIRPTAGDSELLEYRAAIEVSESEPPPEGMVEFRLHAATYARFEHQGRATEVDHTVNYIYSTWLLSSGHRHSEGPDLEIYDHRWHPTSETSRFDYAIPIGSWRGSGSRGDGSVGPPR